MNVSPLRYAALALLLVPAACDTPTVPPSSTPALPTAVASSRLQRLEDPAVPLYGRMTWSDDWAVLALYRPVECVAYGVDLAEPDVLAIPAVFGCLPMGVTGFSLTRAGALAPWKANLRNDGDMVVWFLSRADFDAARADDGRITREEFEAAPSFVTGEASFYREEVHPAPVPGLPGGHLVVHLVIESHGTVADGRRFRVAASATFPPAGNPSAPGSGPFAGQVSIEFR